MDDNLQTMTQYRLLLDRTSQGFNFQIVASCAVVGEPSGYFGLSKTFQNEATLNVALSEARIADFEVNNALTALRSGFKSFAGLTLDQAKSLGLIGQMEERKITFPGAG